MTYMVDTEGYDLSELADRVRTNVETTVTDFSSLKVDFTGDRTIEWQGPRGGVRQVPISEEGIQHLADHLDVPYKFLERNDDALRQLVVDELIKRRHGDFCVRWNDQGVHGFHSTHQVPFEPRQVVQVATDVMGGASEVVKLRQSTKEFSFDVVVPMDSKEGWYGDRKVNDLTGAGLRFGLDVARNLVPWVQPYTYRLVCTNGMELPDDGLKLDARGKTVETVMDELEAMAQRAFGRLEHEINAFYSLRDQRLDNAEQTLIRIAAERGMSDRIMNGIMRRIPELETDDVTMFDLVNLITNEANRPGVTDRVARQLQQVGGGVVLDHSARCAHCASRLN